MPARSLRSGTVDAVLKTDATKASKATSASLVLVRIAAART
jgi:hypothetical protein